MSANANLFLHETYLAEVIEKQPNLGKDGYRQNFIWKNYLKWRDFGTRNILMRRAKSQNQLAGLHGPQGQALPRPKLSGEQFLSTLMDVKSYGIVDPDIVREDAQLRQLMVKSAMNTDAAQDLRAKVQDYINKEMQENLDVVDNTFEYMFVGALLDSLTWPPTDDDGVAISTPPAYWGSEIAGTWSFGRASDTDQTITSLVDWEGNAATTAQRYVWSNASADIIGALDVMDQICVQKYGFTLQEGTILCRSTLLNHIIKNTALLNLLRGDDNTQPGARGYITTKKLREVFIDVTGYTFQPYDTFFTYESLAKNADFTPTSVHYLPANKIVIIPPKGLQGYMGTAKMEQRPGQWTAGLFPWMYTEPKPNYRREMGVNSIAWPVFERTDWFTCQVLA